MKKLILMLLVLAGGVLNVSATDITKRIFVIASDNFGKNRSGDLAIHAWYDGGSDITTWNTDAEIMVAIGTNTKGTSAKGLWLKDITFDASKTIHIKVYDKGNNSWQSGDLTLTSSTNKYYSFDISSSNALSERGNLSYYAYWYDGTSTWTKGSMTTIDNSVFTASLDNQTSPNASIELLFAPNFAVDDDYVSSNDALRFTWMFRPNDSNQDKGFTIQTDLYGGFYVNANSIKIKKRAHYDITFKPFSYQFGISPYITANLNASGYGTFGCSFADFKIPSTDTEDNAVSAYYAESISSSIITMTKKTGDVNKADGLFLIGTPNKSLKFTPATTTPATVSSKLLPGDGTAKTPDASNFYYVLSGNSFKKLTKSTTIPEGKAYLHSTEALANEFTLSFDDGTTAIRVINTDATAIENSDIYNVAGQCVVNPTKGLYIVNGKKVIK